MQNPLIGLISAILRRISIRHSSMISQLVAGSINRNNIQRLPAAVTAAAVGRNRGLTAVDLR